MLRWRSCDCGAYTACPHITPRVALQAAFFRGVPPVSPLADRTLMLSLPRGITGLFRFQLRRKCLRDDLSVAHHERIGGQRGLIMG
jgi:hypothetical protein